MFEFIEDKGIKGFGGVVSGNSTGFSLEKYATI